MKIIYSGQYQEIEGNSIFLAGCSPRKGQELKWRQDAIKFFKEFGFNETLIYPEPETGHWDDYENVVEWEHYYLQRADIIMFWIPRSIKDEIYGFTSNVEFGKYLHSGKIVYGRPDNSDNNKYLDYWYEKIYGQNPENNLFDTCLNCMDKLFKSINLDRKLYEEI